MVPLIRKHGATIIHKPFDRTILVEHFAHILKNDALAAAFVTLLEKLPQASPLPITTLFEFVWWINFTLKWQTVYTRMLTFTNPQNTSGITETYLRDYYAPFYGTEQFQLWSLNNPDKRIKDTWLSYKWPCKEIIYEFTHDAEYRATKMKAGSLGAFMGGQQSYIAVDESLRLLHELDGDLVCDPVNDFALLDTHLMSHV
jgi:hypothetical protein